MCKSTGKFNSIYFLRITPFFELRNFTKMKDRTETICQHNSSETAQQNFLTLCSNDGHNVLICISTENFDSFFFSQNYVLLNLGIWQILLKRFVSATSLKPLNWISWNIEVMKNIPCRCAYPKEMLIHFFLEVTPFFNFDQNKSYLWFSLRLPVTYAWNCLSLYTAFSRNGGAWSMWACSLFLSFSNVQRYQYFCYTQTQTLNEKQHWGWGNNRGPVLKTL